jgi:hypothetical protein
VSVPGIRPIEAGDWGEATPMGPEWLTGGNAGV